MSLRLRFVDALPSSRRRHDTDCYHDALLCRPPPISPDFTRHAFAARAAYVTARRAIARVMQDAQQRWRICARVDICRRHLRDAATICALWLLMPPRAPRCRCIPAIDTLYATLPY